MYVDINEISTYNGLYSLGLTEEDLANIAEADATLKGLSSNERNNTDRLFYCISRGTTLVAVKAIDYKERLFLKIYEINPTMENSGINEGFSGYGYIYRNYSSNYLSHRQDDISLKDCFLSEEGIVGVDGTLNKLKESLKSLSALNSFGVETEVALQSVEGRLDGLEGNFKKILLENYENINRQGTSSNVEREYFQSDAGIQKFVELLGDDVTHTTNRDNFGSDTGIGKITDVFECGNYRMFLCRRSGYSYNREVAPYEVEVQFKILPAEHRDYNWIDVGRSYIPINKTTTEKPFASAIFMDLNGVVPDSDLIPQSSKNVWERGDNTYSIDGDTVNTLLAKAAAKEQKEKERVNPVNIRDAVKAKLEKKAAENKTIKLADIEFTAHQIVYAEQVLAYDDTNENNKWGYKILEDLLSTYGSTIDNINFDNVFSAFVTLALPATYRSKETYRSGTIGTVKYAITEKETTNALGNASKRSYINGVRINAKELRACLLQAICFTEQADYDQWLKTVSKVSIQIHKYLLNGIETAVTDELNHERLNLKFPLVRKTGNTYIRINEVDYKVRNIHKLVNIRSERSLLKVAGVLMDDTIVSGILSPSLSGIVTGAREAFRAAVEKSRVLLKQTEKVFNLTYESNKTIAGKRLSGYQVNGNRNKYFIEYNPESKDNEFKVWNAETGDYFCIVDKSHQQVGVDGLVNRIYALHNDSALANQIHTI
jgi:hypothetical protein